MPISAVDSISPAYERAKSVLFHPFRLGQWGRIALVGLLAGELSSGGGCQMPSIPHNTRGSEHFLAPGFPFPSDPAMYAGLIAALAAAGFILWLVLLYVSSVMRFILFDSVVEKECRIRKGWRRRHGAGVRYFFWKLVIAFGSFAGFGILVGVPAILGFALGWLQEPKDHILPLVLVGLALFFALVIFVIGLLILEVVSKDFLIPQIALDDISAFEAWRRWWVMMKQEKAGYAGYLGMKLVLAIAAGILAWIATMVLLIILLIPVGGLGIIAVLAGKTAGLTWDVYTITLAVVAGSIALAGILYLTSLISVPFIVFFPAYSIHFFAGRYPKLAALIDPPPAPPIEGMPLPPQPEPAL